MKGRCLNCGRTGEMKKVWRSGGIGKSVQTQICKDQSKCIGSKAWRQAQLKMILKG